MEGVLGTVVPVLLFSKYSNILPCLRAQFQPTMAVERNGEYSPSNMQFFRLPLWGDMPRLFKKFDSDGNGVWIWQGQIPRSPGPTFPTASFSISESWKGGSNYFLLPLSCSIQFDQFAYLRTWSSFVSTTGGQSQRSQRSQRCWSPRWAWYGRVCWNLALKRMVAPQAIGEPSMGWMGSEASYIKCLYDLICMVCVESTSGPNTDIMHTRECFWTENLHAQRHNLSTHALKGFQTCQLQTWNQVWSTQDLISRMKIGMKPSEVLGVQHEACSSLEMLQMVGSRKSKCDWTKS